jgi:hypothetical protein
MVLYLLQSFKQKPFDFRLSVDDAQTHVKNNPKKIYALGSKDK